MVNKFLYPRGGAETYMLALGEEFASRGHQVEYFGMYDKKNTVSNSAGLYTQNMDFHSNGIARFFYPFKILYSFEAKRKLVRVIDRFKPDVIHMNNINFQLTPSVICAAKKRNVPVIQTVHDYQMICPNHLLYNFEKNEICEACMQGNYKKCIQNKCIHSSRVKSILGVLEAKLYAFLKTYQKVDLYLCPSYFLEGKLQEAKPFYRGKTKTIHNFISKNDFEKKAEKPYIAFAGRLSKEKGIESLAQAARLLPEYTFRIAGSGPDEALLDGIANVERVGFLTGKPLRDFMGNAKLLVVPSIWYENCPLSILESQSYGVPVVTVKSGGMAELVKDGVSGILIDDASPEKMAEKIRHAMENEAYYQTLKENCEKEKDQILTVSSYSDLLMEEYKKIISR